jgi:hypothetical protein
MFLPKEDMLVILFTLRIIYLFLFLFFAFSIYPLSLLGFSKSLQYFLGGYCFMGEGVGDHAGMGGFIR